MQEEAWEAEALGKEANFLMGIEHGRAESERRSCGRIGGSLEQMEHVFSSLFEIILGGEFGEGDFFGEEIYSENVLFGHGVGEIAFVTAMMLR